jgi:hypothetical protein
VFRQQEASTFAALPSRALLLVESLGARVQQPEVVVEGVVVVLLVWPTGAEEAVWPVVLPEAEEEGVLRVVLPEGAAAVAPHAEAVALRVLAVVTAEPRALVVAAVAQRAWRRVAVPVVQASPEAARPLASVYRPDRVLPWPAPRQQARSAPARRSLQIASQ